MGSVLVFKDPACDPKLLHNLEARGIGERRAEGFGRIVFNRQRVTKLETTENMRKSPGLANLTINQAEARDLAKLMVNRMLKKWLDERLLAAANTMKVANPPSNAQISRLRSIVIEELRRVTPGTGRIRRFIESIEARGSARRQFERSTINEESLLRWLKRLLRDGSHGAWTMDDNEWKALLGLSGAGVGAQIGDVKANIDDALRLEYVLRLIDLVLARAAKQPGKEN
jgi:CRISPR-associated protein Csx10